MTTIEHMHTTFPHEPCCAGCANDHVCNVCGTPALRATRCTNGRCPTCHGQHCTPGGDTSPGHAARSPFVKFTGLDQLQDGVRVLASFANRDNADGSAPAWRKPQWVNLYVQRRAKAYKRHPAGEIVTLTPTGFTWAEYRQGDYEPTHNEFTNEEYRMQILEVAL